MSQRIAAETQQAFRKSGFDHLGNVWYCPLGEDRALVVEQIAPTKFGRAIVKGEMVSRDAQKAANKLEREMKRTGGGRMVRLAERRVRVETTGETTRLRDIGAVRAGRVVSKPQPAVEPEREAEREMHPNGQGAQVMDREFQTVRPEIEWETLSNETEAHRRLPIVGIHLRPDAALELSLNRLARERLGDPEYITVKVSKKGDAIGIGATTRSDFNAFKVSTNGRVTVTELQKKLGLGNVTEPRSLRMEGMMDGSLMVAIMPDLA